MDREFKNGKTEIDTEYIDMIIINFNDAISKKSDKVYLGYEILNETEIKEYFIYRNEWEHTLNIILKTAINMEEYEQCILLKDILNAVKE